MDPQEEIETMRPKHVMTDDKTGDQLIDDTDCTACLGNCAPSPKLVLWPLQDEHVVPSTFPTSFICYIVIGSLLAITGITTLAWKPVDILLRERLRMVRLLPPFQWWKYPPDEVFLRAYVFNVTNSEEFMRGDAEKLHVQEIGPYVFREKLYHTNVEFNDNGTMTYTATRVPQFLPEMNNLSLDDRIVVANLAVLGMPSYMWDATFFTRLGLSMLINRMGSEPFVEISVRDYFWNFTDPLLKFTKKIAPRLVPVDNMGILHEVYRDFVDNITVYTGVDSGDFNFFKIDKWRGGNGMGKWENETCDSVQGSTEGVHFHQKIKRTDYVKYLRKTICRAVPLYYSRDLTMYGMNVLRFDLPNSTWSRDESTEDCYRTDLYPPYPPGVSDVSPCYFNLPVVSSFPHFMSASPEVTEKLDGLSPNWEKHGSAAIIEPLTGIPTTAWARSQCSLFVQDMKGFPKYKRLSRMPIPMFWLEYKQMGLPSYITSLMYLVAVILPSIQLYISLGFLFLAFLIFSNISSKIFNNFMLKKKGSYTSINVIFSKSRPKEHI